jgi:hypothetical protein
MNKYKPNRNNFFSYLFFCSIFLLVVTQSLKAQIAFNQSNLNFNGNGDVSAITSLNFGPDGRLYVVEYTGAIKILTIERLGPLTYNVIDNEVLDGILTIQDYNDDGTVSNASARETIGIAVGGTAVNPVFYISSSDIRIGAGSGGGNGDVGLDTNSGIITRFSFNGTSWDVVDIVRGLPRSEENHATNGLELATINGTNYLVVAQGGHTNGGSPSINFVLTCEYALSGAVLAIDLDMLDTMPTLDDNGRSYIYDIPTLDDPTRPNVDGITDPDTPGYTGEDIYDPFGGNDGLNMAIVVPGGPVQILSPGYRNAYDLVVTENGALYVSDNGANQGWGGFPANEGGGSVTNAYINPQPGDTGADSDGEFINNADHLQLVTTDLETYTFNSFYGGHPNPVRANPLSAGLYTDNSSSLGAFGPPIWRTQVYDPDGTTPGSTTNANEGLPSNWPPVQIANSVEGDWSGPGIPNPEGPDDNPVVIWGTNTNSIDEYTATNFDSALQGNLLAGHSGGNIRRVILSADGASGTLEPTFFSGIGGNVLGLTCNSDTDIFPGTVWAGAFNGIITVFEPQDAFECLDPEDDGYNALADYDGDGYTNQDEEDNETDPCNGGSQPLDFDKLTGGTLISDLNDIDDDSDNISDALDAFQLGDPLTTGSDAFSIPIANDLFNDQQGLGGIFGLGMTGLMNNGDTGLNWLEWIDRRDDPNDPNPNDVLGGAPGIMTSHMTSGTALSSTNSQEKGYQYGVQVNSNTAPFSVIGGMNGFSGGSFRLYGNTEATGGELGFFIGDGTQSDYIKFVVTTAGFTVLQEINDVPQTAISASLPEIDRPSGGIRFYFVVNPQNGQVVFDYKIDSNPRVNVATIIAQGRVLEALQQHTIDLAVGFIGTSGVAGVELEGSWDFLNVLYAQPFITSELPNINRLIGSAPESINLNDFFTDDGGAEELIYTIVEHTDSSIAAVINANALNLSFPATVAISNITIRATDGDANFIEQTFTINVTEDFPAIYRVNTGGPEIATIDDGINWSADTTSDNSEFLIEPGSNFSYNGNISSTTGTVDTDNVPLSIFATERSDLSPGEPNITYAFPVAENGNYEVRLYMGNTWSGTNDAGERVFSVSIEDNFYPELINIDLSSSYGHQVGTMISQIVAVNDGVIDIILIHDVENPLINGIEILQASSLNTPIYVNHIENQLNFAGQALNGSLGLVTTGGDGNLQYEATGLPPGVFIDPSNGQIGGTIASNAQDNSPYSVTIIVDDSDAISSDAVTLQFTWTIIENPLVIFRLDAGGAAVTSTDDEINWIVNNTIGAIDGVGYSVNTGNIAESLLIYENRHVSIPSYIDEATYNAIFAQERWDSSSGAEMEFNIPLPNGDYIVNLFMGNYYEATSQIGERIFDISLEGTIRLDNLDLIVEFGHLKGGMISLPVSLLDEEMTILFEHTGAENPLINAIEILTSDGLIYNGIDWFPNAPDETTASENVVIMGGEYLINSDTEVHNLIVKSEASLIIEPGNAITTNGDINVSGNGFIELQSTSIAYASLIANGAVNGRVIYKRHVNSTVLSGASGSNDLISPPLSGQPFNDFVTTNTNIVSNDANTLYLFGPFNKTNGAYDIYAGTETATLDAGVGYRAASANASTFKFVGTVNTGSIAVPISNSGPTFQQWNLIGNPYPSYLNVATFLSTNTSAFGTNNAAIYGYDGDASDGWIVWNQAYAQSHPEDLITPGQGFFVASEALEGTINFLPSMRVKGQSDDFIANRSTSSLPGFLTLNLNQNNKTYHTNFYFNPNASRGLDKGYDAQVWGGNVPNFGLFSYLVEENAGLPMVIQSLGETDYADVQIPLGISANVGEQISISISENTLPSTIAIYLEDQLTQSTVLLNTGDYVLTPSSTLNSPGRFFLRFTDRALSSDTSIFNGLNVYSDTNNQSIVIAGLISEPSIAKLYDVQGRQVILSTLRLNTNTQNIDVNGLQKGIYIISVESAYEKITKKLIIR